MYDRNAAPPRLLVSVRDVAEAEVACAADADLVDAKDPSRGALGALAPDIVRAIVASVNGRATTSAVAGEAKDADALARNVAAMAATGVAYVKVAVGPTLLRDEATLARIASAAPGRLIGVLFAETGADPVMVPRLAAAGFVGVMIDTAGKTVRRLTDLIDVSNLSVFVAACRSNGLISGLAGSLGLDDIPNLKPLGSSYLGFRGGLCEGSDRTRGLDPARIFEAASSLRASDRRDAA